VFQVDTASGYGGTESDVIKCGDILDEVKVSAGKPNVFQVDTASGYGATESDAIKYGDILD
jgi:hypothetical protein